MRKYAVNTYTIHHIPYTIYPISLLHLTPYTNYLGHRKTLGTELHDGLEVVLVKLHHHVDLVQRATYVRLCVEMVWVWNAEHKHTNSHHICIYHTHAH
ncbi:hypothetical protein EON63_13940 [archaeon]|nr:MAG: hypothetical protein EON63_13940 [archaeon]